MRAFVPLQRKKTSFNINLRSLATCGENAFLSKETNSSSLKLFQ